MKRIICILFCICLFLSGCGSQDAQIAATTLPVYEFTIRICQNTGLQVTRLVTESVSCLHDYSLQVSQMRAIESAEVIVLSGAGLEEFLSDALNGANTVIDASLDVPLICSEEEHGHDHDHEDHGHHHEQDPHIWLSPENAKIMAENICTGLSLLYPEHKDLFLNNLDSLIDDLDALQAYGMQQLSDLSCREMITFHDGFSYLAQEYDLHILEAVEEESGSEASAQELIELIEITRQHALPAIFTEISGSLAAADIIARETGSAVYSLDMAMSGDSYFSSMYHNIDTLKEALG